MKAHLTLHAMTSAVALALFVIGCSSVTIEQPLSAQPMPVDKEKFEGAWLLDKSVLTVKFASNGIARIAGVEWKDDCFKLAQGEMVITKGTKDNFMSVRFEEDGGWTDQYYFLQYTFTDHGDLVLWLPNGDEFEAAIMTNALQGVVTKADYSGTVISVTNTPGKLLDFMNDPQRQNLFEYREPMVLRKVAAPEKAEPTPPGDSATRAEGAAFGAPEE